MWRISLGLILGMFMVATYAGSVTTVGEVARTAMEMRDKAYEAELEGPQAETIRTAIQSPGTRIVVKAKVLEPLSAPGCFRVENRVMAPESSLRTTSGANAPYEMTVTLNLCRDGSMPPAP